MPSSAASTRLGIVSLIDTGSVPVDVGGTSVEVVDDTATGLAPIDAVLAGDLIDRTRISRLLAGYRDRPPADRGAECGLGQVPLDGGRGRHRLAASVEIDFVDNLMLSLSRG